MSGKTGHAPHIAERLAQPNDLATLYVVFGLLAAVGALVVFVIVLGLQAIARREVGWQPDRDEPGATRDR